MHEIKKELREIIKSIKGYMEAQSLAGIEELYLDLSPGRSSAAKLMPKAKSLAELYQQALKCKQCPLYETRNRLVFGEGNPQAKLVFVGEAPGREEDQKGAPFVGQAGLLLNRFIEAMGLKRKDIYICNVLKCRPPENRSPLPSEIIACQDYLYQQLEIIKPKIILSLGRYAYFALLKQDLSITKLRGNFQDFCGIKVMPTFHPAYLLRNPQTKRLFWQDLQKVALELKKA